MTSHDDVRNIVILGSTGSIGCSTLEVAAAAGKRLRVLGLTAHRSFERLLVQTQAVRPRWAVATDGPAARQFDWSGLPAETELLVGADGVERLASHPDVDVVVAAIVGSAGLRGAWAALEAGKTLALANKETLVMAGPLVMQRANACGATILPVDSEHSAVFQALQAGRREDLKRIILTASGGPFREHTREQLEHVTREEALAHPTWEMGPKITIDSATMMNKALEIIEARWLFGLQAEQIEVVVHPQSIVHSLVEFRDGSVLAQLSPPDMKLPIQYALTYPQRWECPAAKLDFTSRWSLEFQPPDLDRFPALGLGYEVARRGGTAGAVLNASNEAAVARFLEARMRFTEIVPACRAVLEHHNYDPSPSLEQLLELDAWARKEMDKWIGA
ncbi:MAG: 1-deoxy-D-xylulose-5-phosphate reductoisomerase [Planctomycetota bacterium]|nr:1-deoxy-D-xylulose-5-phosphate reductoisomerase [Planctomycetota bacterium]